MKAKSERRRPFIGDQLEECRDVSGLYYILPVQKVAQLGKRNFVLFSLKIIVSGIFNQLGHTKRCMGLFIWKRLFQCANELH